jgi:hypothetical protein
MAIDPATLQSFITVIGPSLIGITAVGTAGWLGSMWLRMRHGYPLESSWGKPMLPDGGGQTMERVKLLAQENAQLKAELGSVKDRLQVLERIVVDRGRRLADEIDGLETNSLTKGLN